MSSVQTSASVGGTGLRIAGISLRRRRVPYAQRSLLQRVGGVIGGVWDTAAWTMLAVLCVVAASRPVGGVAPTIEPLRAVLPVLLLPAYGVLVVSVLGRRWLQTVVAFVLCVSHLFAVAPARRHDAVPYWVAGAATVRVATVDVRMPAAAASDAIAAIAALGADVVVLTDVTPDWDGLLQSSASLAGYSQRLMLPRADHGGVAVLSRLAIDDRERLNGVATPVLRIRLPGGGVMRVLAVQTATPTSSSTARVWAAQLRAIDHATVGSDVAMVAVGNFHGTRWQPSFGALLASGLRDAHEAVGQGLGRSWPMRRYRPVARLGHALADQRLFPTRVDNFAVSGSDHRGFVVTYAVQPERAPGPIATAQTAQTADAATSP